LSSSGCFPLFYFFKEAGIDIYCHAPDSVDVMRAWLERDDKSGLICALPDPERHLTSELGIGMDKHARGLGYVPKRYAMVLVRDEDILHKYIIRHLAIEDDAAQCGITSAESILKTAKSFLQ
jgi:peroxiredoxin